MVFVSEIDVLIEEGEPIIRDYEIIPMIRSSCNFLNAYEFRGGITTQSKTMEFEKKKGIRVPYRGFMGPPPTITTHPSYFRIIDRMLRNDIGRGCRWEGADTFGESGNQAPRHRIGKGKWGDSGRTFRRGDRSNCRGVNRPE